jgi:hypothetical protein
MVNPVRAFLDVARCEDVSTSSNLGRVVPLPRRRGKRVARRSAELHIRMTRDEQARWRQEAVALDLTLSDLVRAKMDGRTVAVARVTDRAVFAEIRRQGINLNQLLHAAHSGLLVDRLRLDATLEALTELYGQMLAEFS